MLNDTPLYTDLAVARVREAVGKIGKKPLAEKAAVADGVLRNVDCDDYSPHTRVLRKLEKAALPYIEEKADSAAPPAHGQSRSKVNRGAR